MDTLDLLTRRGYRIYKMKMRLTDEIKEYFKFKLGLYIDYHETLKVITIRDAKSKS